MTDDASHFTAKDHLLEHLRDLREEPERLPIIRQEVKTLTSYLLVAELELLTDSLNRHLSRIGDLLERLDDGRGLASRDRRPQNDEAPG